MGAARKRGGGVLADAAVADGAKGVSFDARGALSLKGRAEKADVFEPSRNLEAQLAGAAAFDDAASAEPSSPLKKLPRRRRRRRGLCAAAAIPDQNPEENALSRRHRLLWKRLEGTQPRRRDRRDRTVVIECLCGGRLLGVAGPRATGAKTGARLIVPDHPTTFRELRDAAHASARAAGLLGAPRSPAIRRSPETTTTTTTPRTPRSPAIRRGSAKRADRSFFPAAAAAAPDANDANAFVLKIRGARCWLPADDTPLAALPAFAAACAGARSTDENDETPRLCLTRRSEVLGLADRAATVRRELFLARLAMTRRPSVLEGANDASVSRRGAADDVVDRAPRGAVESPPPRGGTALVVEAPAGAGASRLVAAWAKAAGARDCRVVRARADAFEPKSCPFAAAAACVEGDGSWNGRVVAAGRAAPRERPLRRLAIEAAAGRARPLIVIIDDGHELDSAGWALAEAFERDVPGALLVVVARPGDDARPVPRVLAFSGLADEEIEAVGCETFGGAELEKSFRERLVDYARGNAAFANAVCDAIRGDVASTRGALALRTSTSWPLPLDVAARVGERLEGLDAERLLALKTVAVAGGSIDADDVAACHAADGVGEAVAAAVSALVRGGFLTEDRGRVVALAGGPAERDALLERMLAADRARLRDRLARFAARRRVAARPATGPVAKRGEVLVLKRYGAVSLSRSAGHARGRASSWPSGKERFVARHAVVGPDGLVIYRSPLAFERGDAPYLAVRDVGDAYTTESARPDAPGGLELRVASPTRRGELVLAAPATLGGTQTRRRRRDPNAASSSRRALFPRRSKTLFRAGRTGRAWTSRSGVCG